MSIIENIRDIKLFRRVSAGSMLKLSVIIMFLIIMAIGLIQGDAVAEMGIRKATICFCLWLLFSILSYYNSSALLYFIICSIALWGGYESVLGIVQMVEKITYSYGGSTTSAGSFFNPGPYGGFLACVISVLIPSYLKSKDKNNLLVRLYRCLLLTSTVLSIIVLSFTNSRAAVLSLICSLFIYVIGTAKGKMLFRRFAIPLSIIALVVCSWGYLAKRQSADGRLFLDKICLNAIADNNIGGAGLGHFGEAYELSQYNYYKKDISIENGVLSTGLSKQKERQKAWSPHYAFNIVLLIGMEMGPIAMTVFVLIILLTAIVLYKSQTPLLYGFLTVTIFGFFSYPLNLWQFQLLYSVFIAAASYTTEKKKTAKRVWANLILLIIAVSVLSCSTRKAISTANCYNEWDDDRKFLNMDRFDLFSESCSEKEAQLGYMDIFMIEYGYALSKAGLIEKSDSVFKACQVYETNPNMLVMMGDNCIEREDYEMAEKYYKDAFIMLPDRITPLYKLANLYVLRNDTAAFRNMINSINDYSFKIESNRTWEIRNKLKQLEKKVSDSVIPVTDLND